LIITAAFTYYDRRLQTTLDYAEVTI